MNIWLMSAIVAVVCYLIGGINGAIIFSKIFYHEDIREKGSGNPGFTNFKRVYGMNYKTVLVFFFDVLKTVIPTLASSLIFSALYGNFQLGAQLGTLFCMIGHCFPVWYKFKGGKAFLAGAAGVWFVDWRMSLIALAIFALLLFTVKFMSLSSMCAAISCPISLAFFGYSHIAILIMAIIASALVVARHHANIVRLIKGTETKFSLSNKDKKDKA